MREPLSDITHNAGPVISAGDGDEALWLLQTDDSRILYYSLFLSLLLHTLLFVFLAATRIFHPFAGPLTNLDLFWFTSQKHGANRSVRDTDVAAVKNTDVPSDRSGRVPAEAKTSASPGKTDPSPHSAAAAAPAETPPGTAAGMTVVPSRWKPEKGDTELVITRFEGKVVEIVDRNAEIPVFRTFSAAVKSEKHQAKVQYYPEEDEPRIAGSMVTEAPKPPPIAETERKKPGTETTGKELQATADPPIREPLKKTGDIPREIAPVTQPRTSARVVIEEKKATVGERKTTLADTPPVDRTERKAGKPETVAHLRENPAAAQAPLPPAAASIPVKPAKSEPTSPNTATSIHQAPPQPAELPAKTLPAAPPVPSMIVKPSSLAAAATETAPVKQTAPQKQSAPPQKTAPAQTVVRSSATVPEASRTSTPPPTRPRLPAPSAPVAPATHLPPPPQAAPTKPAPPVTIATKPASTPPPSLQPQPPPPVISAPPVPSAPVAPLTLVTSSAPAGPVKQASQAKQAAQQKQSTVSAVTSPPAPFKSATAAPNRPSSVKTAEKETPAMRPRPPEAPRSSHAPGSTSEATPSIKKPSGAVDRKSPQLFLPPLFGDLKLVITGEADISVEANFRVFPKARRGKPSTKTEARNLKNVPPKVVRTGENVREAVLELTEEGIYYLVVRPSGGNSVNAGFVLRIHEKGTGAKTVNLGRRTISDRSIIARVLMPEGILWDDDKYFSGDMEDSESITKFNNDTGLIWKEYK